MFFISLQARVFNIWQRGKGGVKTSPFNIIFLMSEFLIPTADQLKSGIEAFYKNERRSVDYFKAISHINKNWGIADEMATGASILLHSWHMYFYSFGDFIFFDLSNSISKNISILEIFRERNILDFCHKDKEPILLLFKDFLDALKRKNKRESRSAVSVAKTIHLFAPNFFPLWDGSISLAYGTFCGEPFSGTYEYITFCFKIQEVIKSISEYDIVKNPEKKIINKNIR